MGKHHYMAGEIHFSKWGVRDYKNVGLMVGRQGKFLNSRWSGMSKTIVFQT